LTFAVQGTLGGKTSTVNKAARMGGRCLFPSLFCVRLWGGGVFPKLRVGGNWYYAILIYAIVMSALYSWQLFYLAV